MRLPALQATAPPGCRASASIQAPLVSASVRVDPSGPVTAMHPSSPPVTSRAPSLAAARIAPSGCAATRCVAPSRASSTAPSPSAKAIVSPSQAAPVTWAPGSRGATCGVREGVASGMTGQYTIPWSCEEGGRQSDELCDVRGMERDPDPSPLWGGPSRAQRDRGGGVGANLSEGGAGTPTRLGLRPSPPSPQGGGQGAKPRKP